MRILLISDNFPPRTGGSGRWFREIYGRLPRSEYVIAAGEDARQDDYDRSHDLRVVRLPLEMPSWGVRKVAELRGYWRAVRPLLSLAKSERVRMIHCGRCLPEGVMALAIRRLAGIPYACYVHGEDVTCATTSRELTWLTRRVLNGAEYVIANSRNTESILKDSWGLPPGRVRLLYPGVDTARFVPAARDPVARGRLGWGDRPVVLTVGRLQKRKGQDQLIRALVQVRRSVPDVLYAILGDGRERAELTDLVSREGLEGHVQFMGEVDDETMIRCYQQCDLFALPNRRVGQDIEGFGMVLLEAQACGKPVLAGASGGTAETLRDPETGRVVPCDGPEELASVVVELLSDRGRLTRMGASARAWVVGRFDWESLACQAEELFQGRTRPVRTEPVAEPAR